MSCRGNALCARRMAPGPSEQVILLGSDGLGPSVKPHDTWIPVARRASPQPLAYVKTGSGDEADLTANSLDPGSILEQSPW